MGVFAFGAEAQYPLWASGADKIDFQDGLSVSGLPQPAPLSGNPAYPAYYFYDGWLPQHQSHIQFDQNGELLFFILDGVIFNNKGYMIADAYHKNHNQSISWPNIGLRPGIAVISRPGECMQYYIFYDFAEDNGNYDPTAFHVLLLDVAAMSDLYNSTIIYGSLIPTTPDLGGNANGFSYSGLTTFNAGDFPQLIASSFQDNDGPFGLALNKDAFGDEKESFTQFEVIETGQNQNKLVLMAGFEHLVAINLNENGIQTWSYDDFNTGLSGRSAKGELEAIRSSITGNYLVAFNQSDDGSNGAAEIKVKTFLPSLAPVSGLTTIFVDNGQVGNLASVYGLEFSPNGRYLYFSLESVANNFGYIDMSDNSVHFIGSLDIPTSFANSKMELNMLPDAETPVIYIYGPTSLGAIGNTTDPANLTWTPDILDANDINSITYFNGDQGGQIVPIFRNMQGQNLNGIQQQYFMQGAACCEDVSRPNSLPFSVVNSTMNGTWTNGNNPFGNVSGPVIVTENLIFPSGTNVTITGMTFQFGPNATVYIQPGASLMLSGSTFTNLACGTEMWPGVRVIGNPNLSQTSSNQGYLRMWANSLIEHAYMAIGVGTTSTNGGGIVRIDNSRIRNCRDGISWKPYIWFAGGSAVGNVANINKLTSIIDAQLLDANAYPGTMAYLNRVHLIRFNQCSFINETDESVYSYQYRGTGIYSSQSSFTCDGLNASYDGPGDNLHTAFHRLNVGIFSYGFGSSLATHKTKKMEFESCQAGIINAFTNYPEVVFNNFYVPYQNDQLNTPLGAYFQASTGYQVQENFFYGIYDDPEDEPTSIGCWINNSGQNSDLVRRNSFDHLKIGSLTEAINAHAAGQAGLQWLCNMYTNNLTDIERAVQTSIRHDQGGFQIPGISIPAGNQFSEPTGCVGNYSDFKVHANQSTGWYTVYYHNSDVHSIPDCSSPWFSLANNNYGVWTTATCPTDYSSGGPSAGMTLENTLTETASAKAARDAFVLEYESIMNQGNTTNLLAALYSVYPQESVYVRNLLLANFPLSRQVLQVMLEHAETMEPGHLTQVLVANSPLDPDLMGFLENNPILSPYFMSFVNEAQQGNPLTTLRNMLNAQMAGHQTGYATLRNRAMRALLLPDYDPQDEEAEPAIVNLNTINALWAEEESPMTLRMAANEAVNAGNYTEAISLLNPFASDPWLGGLSDLLTLEAQVNGDWTQADANQQAALEAMWLNEENPSRYLALSVLHMLGLSNELPSYQSEPTLKTAKVEKPRVDSQSLMLTVFPTNATTEVFVGYPAEADGTARLFIYSSDGRLIESITLIHNGYLTLDVSRWSQGLYLISLHNGNSLIANAKFNLVK